MSASLERAAGVYQMENAAGVAVSRLCAFAIIALVAFLYLWLIRISLAVPVVEWSWTTGECVRVLPPEAGRCDQLPERYERVWVR